MWGTKGMPWQANGRLTNRPTKYIWYLECSQDGSRPRSLACSRKAWRHICVIVGLLVGVFKVLKVKVLKVKLKLQGSGKA